MSKKCMLRALEPCSFVGRTPACSGKLVQSKIKDVVVSIVDPDSGNSGKGIQYLESAHSLRLDGKLL